MAIASVIKYEGDNKTFVWKHPNEDFNMLSQLIVHESQEAILFLNGQALDLFGPGRHTLESENIPILGKILNITTKKTPFHCEVYFINKAEQMSIKWGTDSKVQYMDPIFQFPLSIGASGEMSLRVEDSRKLLVKLVGTEKNLSQDILTQYFRSILMTKVKSSLASYIKENEISIFEIDEHLSDMSSVVFDDIQPEYSNYGISLERFFITTIVKPDGDRQYEKYKDINFRQYAEVAEANLRQKTAVIDAQTRAQQTIIESQALATKRLQEGYTYQQERGFDVAQDVARNEASGQFTNLGVGLGTMAGVGGTIGGVVGGAVSGAVSNTAVITPGEKICPSCGNTITSSAKFCLECGYKFVSACPKCNASLPEGSKFCLECGEKI